MVVTRSKRKREELALAADKRSRGSGFKHKPLKYPHVQIRLLKILPGEPDDAIRLESDVFCLDHPPAYNAISYTWGSEQDPKIVYVDDEPLEVRNNCHYALWQVRIHFPGKWIWIDSICINQRDNDEKSHQVQKMFDIYRSARLVLSCVGPHADNSEMVVEAAKEILDLLLEWHRSPNLSHDEESTKLEEFDHLKWASARGESYFIALRKSFDEFSRRPYWSRLWIVQEMRASGSGYNRRLQVLCGHDSLERWPLRVLNLFFALKLSEVARSLSWNTPRMLDFTGMNTTFETIHIHARRLRLEEWLLAVDFLHCSDVRDKLYGFLSIITWPQGFEPITPDYSKSTWDILQELAPALSPNNLMRALKYLDVVTSAKDFEYLARQRALVESLQPDPTWCLSDTASRLGIKNCPKRSIALKSQVPLAVVVRETQLRPLSHKECDLSLSNLKGAIKTFFGIECDTLSSKSYLPIGLFSGEDLIMLVDQRTRPGDLILDLWAMLIVVRHDKDNVYDVVGSAMWSESIRTPRLPSTRYKEMFALSGTHCDTFYVKGSITLSLEDQIVFGSIMSTGFKSGVPYECRERMNFVTQLIKEPEGAVILSLEPYHLKTHIPPNGEEGLCFKEHEECRVPACRAS